MAAPGRFDHLRHSALDLLESGNSTASVAQLLAVPVAVVARWRSEPVPPRPERLALMVALRARGPPIRFRTTLSYAASTWFRVGQYALAVFWAGLLAIVAVPTWRRPDLSFRNDGVLLEYAFFITVAVFAMLRRSQASLVLGPDAVIVPQLFGRKTLPYADLADYWLVLHVLGEGTDEECEGRLLTLHSRRAGVRPIEVFVHDDRPLDPLLVERLDLVRQANRGVTPLTPAGAITTA